MCYKLCFQIYCFIVVSWWNVAVSYKKHRYFKAGGVGKLLNAKKRTIYVERGQEARLRWEFTIDETTEFHGIYWKFLNSTRHELRLISMDVTENQHQLLDVQNRIEYKVHLEEQATLVIPNVQFIHENTYFCYVPRTGIYSSIESQIQLIVTDAKNHGDVSQNNNDANDIPDMDVAMPFPNTTVTVPEPKTTTMPFPNTTVTVPEPKTTTMPFPDTTVTVPEPKTTMPFPNTTLTVPEPKTNASNNVGKKVVKASASDEHQNIAIYLFSGSLVMVIIFISIVGVKKFQNRNMQKPTKRRETAPPGSIETNHVQIPEISRTNVDMRTFVDIRTWSADENSTMTGMSYRDSSDEYSLSNYPSTSTLIGLYVRPTQLPPNQQLANIIMNTVQQHPDAPVVPPRQTCEIERGSIKNLKRIGEGAFGLVGKADLFNENGVKKCDVAVKMLKVFASPEDRRDLISEFNIMRRIDSHKNVVKLVGCVMLSEPIWVVTEYVPHGDLLGFLRKSRGIIDTTYIGKDSAPRTNLSQCQLLKMAIDIARGMSHLSRNQVIHRDLAARNVLVGENIECKITDFGMARDVKSTNYYRKKSRGRIPLKWTAIEALIKDRYTIASDVWSFGVLLYEIVTIGGQPYPDLGARELLRKLRNGWRMKKPSHVDVKLYEIMLQCWANCAEDRPTFSDLAKTFRKLHGGGSEYINMKDYDESMYRNIEDMSENITASTNRVV